MCSLPVTNHEGRWPTAAILWDGPWWSLPLGCEWRQWLTFKGGMRQKRRHHEISLSIFSFRKTLTPILGASLALSHFCSLTFALLVRLCWGSRFPRLKQSYGEAHVAQQALKPSSPPSMRNWSLPRPCECKWTPPHPAFRWDHSPGWLFDYNLMKDLEPEASR